MLAALRGSRALPVTALADRLGLTHQAVSKKVALLVTRGLLTESVDPADARRKRVALSAPGSGSAVASIRSGRRSGRPTASCSPRPMSTCSPISPTSRPRSRPIRWPTGSAVASGSRPPTPCTSRTTGRVKRHFRQLNELWLSEHFAVEDGDRRLLADPAGRIVRRGGAVLFAVAGDDVAGTCALIRHRDQTWELAKMAVAADWRRRGLGRRLTLAAIERSRAGGATQLWLRTESPSACRLPPATGRSAFAACAGILFSPTLTSGRPSS